jgi:hypothetical protein
MRKWVYEKRSRKADEKSSRGSLRGQVCGHGREIKSKNHPVLKNKANFATAQVDISSFLTSKYENIPKFCRRKNKANSKPIAHSVKLGAKWRDLVFVRT